MFTRCWDLPGTADPNAGGHIGEEGGPHCEQEERACFPKLRRPDDFGSSRKNKLRSQIFTWGSQPSEIHSKCMNISLCPSSDFNTFVPIS